MSLLTASQAASKLFVSTQTLRRWNKQGKISSVQVGAHRKYHQDEINRLAPRKEASTCYYVKNNMEEAFEAALEMIFYSGSKQAFISMKPGKFMIRTVLSEPVVSLQRKIRVEGDHIGLLVYTSSWCKYTRQGIATTYHQGKTTIQKDLENREEIIWQGEGDYSKSTFARRMQEMACLCPGTEIHAKFDESTIYLAKFENLLADPIASISFDVLDGTIRFAFGRGQGDLHFANYDSNKNNYPTAKWLNPTVFERGFVKALDVAQRKQLQIETASYLDRADGLEEKDWKNSQHVGQGVCFKEAFDKYQIATQYVYHDQSWRSDWKTVEQQVFEKTLKALTV